MFGCNFLVLSRVLVLVSSQILITKFCRNYLWAAHIHVFVFAVLHSSDCLNIHNTNDIPEIVTKPYDTHKKSMKETHESDDAAFNQLLIYIIPSVCGFVVLALLIYGVIYYLHHKTPTAATQYLRNRISSSSIPKGKHHKTIINCLLNLFLLKCVMRNLGLDSLH